MLMKFLLLAVFLLSASVFAQIPDKVKDKLKEELDAYEKNTPRKYRHIISHRIEIKDLSDGYYAGLFITKYVAPEKISRLLVVNKEANTIWGLEFLDRYLNMRYGKSAEFYSFDEKILDHYAQLKYVKYGWGNVKVIREFDEIPGFNKSDMDPDLRNIKPGVYKVEAHRKKIVFYTWSPCCGRLHRNIFYFDRETNRISSSKNILLGMFIGKHYIPK